MSDDVSRHIADLEQTLHDADEVGADDVARIKDAVAAYGDEGDHETFLGHLRDIGLRFEASHPKLHGAIARVIDSLTASGI